MGNLAFFVFKGVNIEMSKEQSEILTVYYSGRKWEQAIEAGLREKGLKRGDCAVIALPESMRPKKRNRQRDLFADA